MMASWQCRMLAMLTWLVCMLVISQAVDRNNFKTCEQSSFCRRQRKMEKDSNEYKALRETLKTSHKEVAIDLKNVLNGVLLTLELTHIGSNTLRLRIKEDKPQKDRYEPDDVLLTDLPRPGITKVDKNKDGIEFGFGDENTAILDFDPFELRIYHGEEPVTFVNSQGRMKFEHHREKPNAAGEEKVNEEGQQVGEEVDEADTDGLWEETFKGHVDSKPNGPTSVGLDVSFPGFQHVYGIPEHAESLALKTTKNKDPYRLYNLDVFEYELNNPMALYGSVPLLYAHNKQRSVGMFWLNSAETWVDIRSATADKSLFSKVIDFVKSDKQPPQVDTHWFSESGIIDVFFLMGPTPQDLFKQYAVLTGTTALPPLFALAYHQSRWNYNDQDDINTVNANFDKHDIPMDVLWLDIEHTDGKRYFTWDSHKFPDSVGMIKNISSSGRKMVTIVDPHIKRDSNYVVYKDGQEVPIFTTNKDGVEYDGWCWPGSSSWPDFIKPKVRKFWAELFALDKYKGSTKDLYIWNDMNEPSVFNGPEVTMFKDALHGIENEFEHRDVHNIYGMFVHRATFEGLLMRNENNRPFVLSRAFFAGSQRYGAVWTGDNTAEWSHLKMSMPMILSLNLVGLTLSGADVGGFFGNPDVELLVRWYQAGAYQPFFRAHAHIDTKRREPWIFDQDNMYAIRAAIRERYALLPYWYTQFYLSERSGMPVMRPLWVQYPEDETTFAVQEDYLIGPDLLVHPVTEASATEVNVHFPCEGTSGSWYDVHNFKHYSLCDEQPIPVNIKTIPVFQRGGSIIARRDRIRRASSLTYNDPFTLTVALDSQGKAEGTLYIDDYESFDYQHNKFNMRAFTFENNKLYNNAARSNGQFDSTAWLERVVIVGLKQQPTSISLETSQKELTFKYDASTKVLVIRKPDVKITERSIISINYN